LLKWRRLLPFYRRNSVWFPHLLKAEKNNTQGQIRLVVNKKDHNFICSFLENGGNKWQDLRDKAFLNAACIRSAESRRRIGERSSLPLMRTALL